MENQTINQNQPEITKTNFVTIRIDYPTCYRLQFALSDYINNQRSESSYFELSQFRNLLHHTVYSILQKSTAVDIEVPDLFEEPDPKPQQVIDENLPF